MDIELTVRSACAVLLLLGILTVAVAALYLGHLNAKQEKYLGYRDTPHMLKKRELNAAKIERGRKILKWCLATVIVVGVLSSIVVQALPVT